MNLNEYVRLNAAHPIGSVDFLTLYADVEVFFSIDSSKSLPLGVRVASTADEIEIKTAKFPDGEMALFYTSKNDPRLTLSYGGMLLGKAAEMVLRLPVVDGILIQSDGSGWIAVKKEALAPKVFKS